MDYAAESAKSPAMTAMDHTAEAAATAREAKAWDYPKPTHIRDKKYTCPVCNTPNLTYCELAEHTARHADDEDARIEREEAEVKERIRASLDKRISEASKELSDLYRQRREIDPHDQKFEIPANLTPAALMRLFF